MSVDEGGGTGEAAVAQPQEQSGLLSFTLTAATIVNFVLFASELPLVRKLVREKVAERYSFWPSLSMMSLSSLWLNYTFWYMSSVTAYWLNNSVAITLSLVTLYCHARFSQPERRKKLVAAVLAILVFGVIFYAGAREILGSESGKSVCATFTVIVNISFFFAPLSALFKALKALDTSRVPVLLSAVSFCGSFLWTINGYLIPDNFVFSANVVGFALSSGQMGILGYIHWRRKQLGAAAPPMGAAAEEAAAKSAAPDAAAQQPADAAPPADAWAAHGAPAGGDRTRLAGADAAAADPTAAFQPISSEAVQLEHQQRLHARLAERMEGAAAAWHADAAQSPQPQAVAVHA